MQGYRAELNKTKQKKTKLQNIYQHWIDNIDGHWKAKDWYDGTVSAIPWAQEVSQFSASHRMAVLKSYDTGI